MILERIETLLRNKIGLAASVIGSNEIARAAEKRRSARGLPDLHTYLQQLQTSTQELEELIELVIVPETWFFRDGEPFTFLERYVRSEWLPTRRNQILRLLSVPCSFGEEPYSIAMTLLNAGLTSNQFHIDAVDISKKSLLRARRAVYSQNSFRGNQLDFRERYFTRTGDEYQLCEEVKNAVNFMHGNLIDPQFMRSQKPYDVVFCRNVLIYFDQSAREQTLRTLERLLTSQGLLFVGHSETIPLLDAQFISVRHAFAFAYRKKDKADEHLKSKENSKIRQKELELFPNISSKLDIKKTSNSFFKKTQSVKTNNLPKNEQKSPSPSLGETTSFPSRNSTQLPPIKLETVRRLADQGQLSEAATLGETYLKDNCISVEAYVLLGQVYQAQGLEERAEQCFQKAVYLEPNDYEALLHLALIKEHRGDIAKAAVLRQRIQRLQQF